jgi:hypothetical protein
MPNIIKTAAAFALSIAAATASAQHGVTLTINSDDRATFTVLSTGPADIVAIELLAGSRTRDGAVFGPGTAGDLSWQHWGGSERYSVTTLSMDLQRGESEAFAVNLDGLWMDDTMYLPAVYSPSAYVGARALVLWSDGFERLIPMSRGLGGGVFSFSDVIAQPVPEPASAALMLAGCLIVGAVARKTGGAK